MKKNITSIFTVAAIVATQFGTVASMRALQWSGNSSSTSQQRANSGSVRRPSALGQSQSSAGGNSIVRTSDNVKGLSEQFQSLKSAVQNVNKNLKGFDEAIIEVGGEMQQLQSLTRQNDALQSRHNTLQSMHIDLKKERDDLIQKLKAVNQQLDERKKQHEALQSEHATQQEVYKNIRQFHSGQLRNQKEGYERQMQESKKTLTAHLKDTVNKMSGTANEINRLARGNARLTAKVNELVNDITILKESIVVDDDSADDTDNRSSVISRSRRGPRVEEMDD
ncbi:MAG: hypothetical protein LBG04_00950 [Holosporaceae bacterium]|jgi:chromosome segregation ATPase|nr:hypothetical protein [Holosporaceae bacterium]